jgi:hypothetical protein
MTASITPSQRKRPILVTLIAIYQFFIGSVGLVYFARIWITFGGNVRDVLIDNPFSFATPVFSVIAFVIGAGVWRLQPWARHFLIGTTGLAFVRGLTRHTTGALVFRNEATIVPFIAIDLLIWLTLMYYPDVSLAFGEKDEG